MWPLWLGWACFAGGMSIGGAMLYGPVATREFATIAAGTAGAVGCGLYGLSRSTGHRAAGYIVLLGFGSVLVFFTLTSYGYWRQGMPPGYGGLVGLDEAELLRRYGPAVTTYDGWPGGATPGGDDGVGAVTHVFATNGRYTYATLREGVVIQNDHQLGGVVPGGDLPSDAD